MNGQQPESVVTPVEQTTAQPVYISKPIDDAAEKVDADEFALASGAKKPEGSEPPTEGSEADGKGKETPQPTDNEKEKTSAEPDKKKSEPTPDADKLAAEFWEEVAKVHPRAEQDVEDPRFRKFIQSDKRMAKMATSKSPAVGIAVMDSYYEARDAGELDGEPTAPPKKAEEPPKPPEAKPSEKPALKTMRERLDAMNDLVVLDQDGVKRTIGQIREESGDEYPSTLIAVYDFLKAADAADRPAGQNTPAADMTALKNELEELRFRMAAEFDHPGAIKTAMSKEMRAWIATKPPSLQRLYSSNVPGDLGYVVQQYEKEVDEQASDKKKSELRDKKTRKDALHSETVRGNKNDPAKSFEVPDDEAYEAELFEEAANKAAQGLMGKR